MQYEVFRLCADAELGTPDAESGTHIVTGVSFNEGAESILVDGISNPAYWPHLSVMGMSGKLKVDTILLCLLQMIRLMVEFQEETALVDTAENLAESLALPVCAVVATYNGNISQLIERSSLIAQHSDSCILTELHVGTKTRIVVVVAKTGYDGDVQGSELRGHILFFHRPVAAVDEVAADEYGIRILSLELGDPAVEVATGVVVA